MEEYRKNTAALEEELAPPVATTRGLLRETSKRLTDLVRVWADATADQRAQLVGAIFTELQVEDRRIVAVRPRPALAHYFEELVRVESAERETGLEPATTYLEGRYSTS